MCSSRRKAAEPLLRLVDARALEHRRAVVEDVGEGVDLRVGEIHEPPVHPDLLDVFVGHRPPLFRGDFSGSRQYFPAPRRCQSRRRRARERRRARGRPRRPRPSPPAAFPPEGRGGPAAGSRGIPSSPLVQPPSGPTSSATASAPEARKETALRMRRGRNAGGAPRARASARSSGPRCAGQRGDSDCFAASRATLSSRSGTLEAARKLCVRAVSHDGHRRDSELRRLLRDPRQPLRAQSRDESSIRGSVDRGFEDLLDGNLGALRVQPGQDRRGQPPAAVEER